MVEQREAQVLYRPPLEALRFLPEGPYPIGPDRFSWVAIQHGAAESNGSLNLYNGKSKTNQSFQLHGRPGFAFPTDQEGTFVIGCERSVGLYHQANGSWTEWFSDVDHSVDGTIINDGMVWENNLIFGTKDLKFQEKKAGLYLWRGDDRKLFALRNDQVCSNGKAVIRSASGKLTLLDIDTPTRQLAAYELKLAQGSLGERRVVLDFHDFEGFPDGMILCPDGESVIISFYNPNPAEFGETRRYRLEDGTHLESWLTPKSPQATCPQLMLWEGQVKLVITTAVEHMSAERQKSSSEAGSLFIADTDFARPCDSPVFPL